MKAQAKKIVSWYVRIATVCFSLWLLVVSFKLIVLAGTFVTRAVYTVINSVPFVG